MSNTTQNPNIRIGRTFGTNRSHLVKAGRLPGRVVLVCSGRTVDGYFENVETHIDCEACAKKLGKLTNGAA